MDYLWIIVMFISTVRILLLTAPIHCRESIETHLDLRSNSDIKIKYRKALPHADTYSIQLIIISKIFQIEFRCLKSAIGVPFFR